MTNKIKKWIDLIGYPRLVIALFLLVLFIIAPIYGVSPFSSFSDVINRIGINGILVLSMIPMVQSGCGLNFGIPVGLIAGILGAIFSLEFGYTGVMGILFAIAVAIVVGALFGLLYGVILNRVKGDEMIIATYIGFAFVFAMNIFWMTYPFKNPASVQGFKGEGLRMTISVENYWLHAFSDILAIKIGSNGGNPPLYKFIFPTGMLVVLALMCLFVWAFFRTKTGTAITAVGSNPEYARAAGININKMRIISVVLSTVIAAIGMIVYEQGFGFIQTFTAPLAFAFPSVAAILLGGASVNKASIANVIIGTALFQGILTMTPSVMNNMIDIDASEIFRIVVTYGMILYALSRKTRKA